MYTFETMEEMEKFYYGDINRDMIMKAKDALISSDTAYWHKVLGAKVWSEINYRANAFAGLPKEPWVKSSWRTHTAAGDSFPSGAVAEGAASAFSSITDSTHPTIASITATPKLVDHGFGLTWLAYELQGTDDVVSISFLRQQKGDAHGRAISAALVQDVDTPASSSMESLQRVASNTTESATTYLSAATDPDIYGVTRLAGALNAQVSMGTGKTAATLRDLSISLLDGTWSSIYEGGGAPKVIFTRANTIKVWSALLEAERRFNVLGEATFMPRAGGAEGMVAGYEVGFNVATYNKVPIIPCQDLDSSQSTALTGQVGPIIFIDTDYVRLGIRMPTRYVESDYPGDIVSLDKHGFEGHYLTIGELKCYNFAAQGKIRDLK